MQITRILPDGLYIEPQAALSEWLTDEIIPQFAEGLIAEVVQQMPPAISFQEAVYQTDATYLPLITTLLMLDAELKTMVNDKIKTLPLLPFLTYREQFITKGINLNSLRLPPLNPDGHYQLHLLNNGSYVGVRLDIHPTKRVAGHIRLLLARPHELPRRLTEIEGRLTWQTLTVDRINEAMLPCSLLNDFERAELADILHGLK